jgi:hypothetical protein
MQKNQDREMRVSLRSTDHPSPRNKTGPDQQNKEEDSMCMNHDAEKVLVHL